ncbi:MAG: helix-turn-helix transcriptional regulator [Proteobacteria bacterium]|nr:helix-turn-helix transcriptional regulator [Pseudomonadota bacterium]
MILRQMPAIAHEPFRSWFYQRWGRENCIVWARTRSARMPPFRQRLSIKAAWGGREEYLIEGRRVAVEDETFMVLNEGRTYGSQLHSASPVTSFAIFFRPGMAEEVTGARGLTEARLLDDPARSGRAVEFGEQLRSHDTLVSPVLRFIRHHVEAGLDDAAWYEEQLYFLLGRMQSLHGRDRAACARVPAARPGTRGELLRRLGLCIDFIHSNYARAIDLAQMAAAAHLSPYHCLRAFRAVHHCTPVAYLRRHRLQVAVRMLQDTALSVAEVAARAGLDSRSTLFRHVRAAHDNSPSALRARRPGITLPAGELQPAPRTRLRARTPGPSESRSRRSSLR